LILYTIPDGAFSYCEQDAKSNAAARKPRMFLIVMIVIVIDRFV
jgi:hypothetical protein